MPKLISPSFKQRKFVHQYLQHGNRAKAYREVYADAGQYNSERGKAVLEHPLTQEYMRKILDDAGVTDKKLSETLRQIMDASLTTQSLKMATPAHGLKAVEIVARLKDLNPAEKKKIETKNLNLSLEGKSIDELNAMLDTLVQEANTFKRMVTKKPLVTETVQNAEVLP